MKTFHQSQSRGRADHGWLKSSHTFSFGGYHDPNRMGFGALRVINDDEVIPGAGFGTHPHRDMEIISIPLAGALSHRDSEGNSSVIRKGEVQIMSAGTGISHSEFNHSTQEPVSFLQIWVLPKLRGIKPRYEQRAFPAGQRENRLQLVVAPDGRENALSINQDAFFSLAILDAGNSLRYHKYQAQHGIYLFVIQGELMANGQKLQARDGLGITDEESLDLVASENCEILVMEVPV